MIRLAPASGLILAALAGAAHAQPAAPASPPAPRLGATVIHPPTGVDPAMKVAPKPAPRLPTPVIRPPVQRGDTVIVPK